MRRLLPTLVATALALAMAAPAAAQGPNETIEYPFSFGAVDGDYLLLVNASATELCAGGEGGTVTLRLTTTGKGAVVAKVNTTVYAELWDLGSGDFCDGATFLGSGSVRVVVTDNDFNVTGTRMNSFGDMSQGLIRGADGQTWRVTSIWRAQINQDGEFRLLVDRTMVRPMR